MSIILRNGYKKRADEHWLRVWRNARLDKHKMLAWNFLSTSSIFVFLTTSARWATTVYKIVWYLMRISEDWLGLSIKRKTDSKNLLGPFHKIARYPTYPRCISQQSIDITQLPCDFYHSFIISSMAQKHFFASLKTEQPKVLTRLLYMGGLQETTTLESNW